MEKTKVKPLFYASNAVHGDRSQEMINRHGMDLSKTDKQYIDLILSSMSPEKDSEMSISQENRESLKDMVKYLSKLKKDEVIDEKAFTDLLTRVCSLFIEMEVDRVFSKFFEKTFVSSFTKIWHK